MTTSRETMTDAVRRGQEAFTGALQIWADSFQWFVPTSDAKLRGAVELVDKVFDFYHHVLTSQREYTKSLLAVTTSAATKAASTAQNAAKGVQDVAQETAPKRDMHDGAKESALKRS
ncbi:MAG: hypothetical protein JO281_13760 [Pseudonocardiales bacterium]|nr:hypothetical protein [Pseudonocardiales bacterium]